MKLSACPHGLIVKIGTEHFLVCFPKGLALFARFGVFVANIDTGAITEMPMDTIVQESNLEIHYDEGN